MKKIKVIFLVIALSLIGAQSYSQTTVRMRSEVVGYFTISADTMDIVKADKVVKASIYAPSFATDSVTVSGCTFTIDGITTNGMKIPPGEVSIVHGFGYAFSDTLKISCPDIGWVQILIDRD